MPTYTHYHPTPLSPLALVLQVFFNIFLALASAVFLAGELAIVLARSAFALASPMVVSFFELVMVPVASLARHSLTTRLLPAAEPSVCIASVGHVVSSLGRKVTEYFTCCEYFSDSSFRSDRARIVTVADNTHVSCSMVVSILASIRSAGRALVSTGDRMNVDNGGMATAATPTTAAVQPSTPPSDNLGPLARKANVASAGFLGLEPLTELGSGGFGVVYLVREIGSAGLKAAKVLKKLGSSLLILQDEIRMHQFVSSSFEGGCHPNIVRLERVIEDTSVVTLVMEHCSGGTLEDHSSRLGSQILSDAVVAKLLLPVARGVAHLHSLGVAHRDLKLDNILLDANKTPKIADFGLATRERGCRDRCGTVPTMAPEQVNIRAFSPAYDPCKADMWALAIMFWELKFRKRPWEQASYGARDSFEIFLRGSYNFLANEPDLGQDAFFLLLGLLRLNPKERLSAQEVVRRLEKIAQSN